MSIVASFIGGPPVSTKLAIKFTTKRTDIYLQQWYAYTFCVQQKLMEHEEKFSGNPRMGHSYRTLSKMDDEKLKAISNDAAGFLKAMGDGELV